MFADLSLRDALSRPDSDVLTLRIRRAHLYGALGVLVGFALGAAVVRAAFWPSRPAASALVLPAATSGPASTAPAIVKVSSAGRPARGPADAKVTLVAFLDYQCPFCGRDFRETYPLIERHYGSKIRYVVRNFPLTTIHPYAEKAAEAAECARGQGHFWPYHDWLFRHQDALEVPKLKRYARRLGLDGVAFDRCLDRGRETAEIRRDIAAGTAAGVTGTPTFFVNGRRIVGAVPYATMATTIDAALKNVR